MTKSTLVSDVARAACHRWPSLLHVLGIAVLANKRHGPCPICGGKDRFRFDDIGGRGTWFCNHCGAGDGLDLVARANKCSLCQAARLVMTLTPLIAVTPKAPAREKGRERPVHDMASRVRDLLTGFYTGISPYLKARGLMLPATILPEGVSLMAGGIRFSAGALVLPLVNTHHQLTGAQLINPAGEKRLLSGSRLAGSFVALDVQETPEYIIITEGYATALSLSLVTDGSLFAALSCQ